MTGAQTTYVTLLRGINLGPARQVSMPALKQIYVDQGLGTVTTYIRSGNVVCTSAEGAVALRARIEAAIAAELAVDVDVVVRSHDEIVDVLARNPFPRADPAHLAVNFLREPVPGDLADRVGSVALGDDEYVGDGREIYLHLPNGFGRSRLAARMSGLGTTVVATVRNWRTVTRLADLSRPGDAVPPSGA